jgi:hypothetical protein
MSLCPRNCCTVTRSSPDITRRLAARNGTVTRKTYPRSRICRTHNSVRPPSAAEARRAARPPISSAAGAEARGLRPDNTSASYGSRASLPVAIGYRSEGSHSAACARQSRGSGPVAPHPRGGDCNSGASGAQASRAGTPGVDSAQSARCSTGPPLASPWALPVFCVNGFQRLDVQRLIRHHLLQPPVSSSNWRSFFTSLTSRPAYFARHL